LKIERPKLCGGSCRPLLKGLISNPGRGQGLESLTQYWLGRSRGRPASPVIHGIQQPSRPGVAGSGSYGPSNNLNFLATWESGVGGNPVVRNGRARLVACLPAGPLSSATECPFFQMAVDRALYYHPPSIMSPKVAVAAAGKCLTYPH
jgi:hypothetical protein